MSSSNARKDGEAPTESSSTNEEPKRRRQYLRAGERRLSIIEAAQEVFARSNLRGARTKDIAKAANINEGTMFQHFESKEELFHESILVPLMEAMRGLAERAQGYQSAQSVEELQRIAVDQTYRSLSIIVDIFPFLTVALFSDIEIGKKLYCEEILPLLDEKADALRGTVRGSIDPGLVALADFGIFFAVAMDRMFRDKTDDLSGISNTIMELVTTGYLKDFKPVEP